MARRTRKRTEQLLAESRTLTASVQHTIAVLQTWHPGSMPLAIITQQLHAFTGELAAPATEASLLPGDDTE